MTQLIHSLPNARFQIPVKSMRIWACLFTLLLVSGCELAPVRQITGSMPPDWDQRRQRLEAFDQWQIQAKLAVKQESRNDSLFINQWAQDRQEFSIHVSSGLLGLGATRISGSPAFISLQLPDEEPLYSDAPEILLQETLGWSLPLNSLAYWIRGVPAPDKPATMQFDTVGNPASMHQSDWQIELDRYQPLGELLLPRKIVMTHGNVRLLVVVTEWSAQDAPLN